MRSVAAVPPSREALLGPNAQRLKIGLLSARTAAVLRRVIEGMGPEGPDRIDVRILKEAAELMSTAAEAVQAVATGGHIKRARTSLGFGAVAFTVEQAAPLAAAADLPDFFRDLATALDALQSTADAQLAERILPAFSLLADAATRQAGTVGEGRGSLR